VSEPENTQPEEAPESTGAQVEVEELGPCKRKLTVRVPKETIQSEIAKGFDELSTEAVVPGFRRGRAPKRLLETRYGEAVRNQVKEQLISRSYQEALEEHDLEPVSTPDVENVSFEPETELSYEVALEIKPVFEVEGYEGLEVEEPLTEPAEEEVTQALERLREREGRYETVEGAVFGEGSLAVVDCQVTIDGKPYVDRKQAELIGGTQNWLRMVSEDVTAPLLGKTSGEEVSFSTVVRPDFADEDLQGKVSEIRVTFYEIKERQLPEADDEFARTLGAEDLADLNSRIRNELVRQKQTDAGLAVRQQLREHLLTKFDFDLPEEHLREHAEDILKRQRLELQYRGVPLEEIDKHAGELEEASQKQAERDVKLHFILEKIAEKERVFTTENEVENEIAVLAANYRVRPARMRAELERRRMLADLRQRIRERKTVDLVLSKAKVTKATPVAETSRGEEPAAEEPAAQEPTAEDRSEPTPESSES